MNDVFMKVWIGIAISIVFTIIAFVRITKWIQIHSGKIYNGDDDRKTSNSFSKIGRVTDYVLGVTLSQGIDN
jgi:hypothetical protein